MSKLYPAFMNYLEANDLLGKGTSALVSVSGGIDSMVLLDLLSRASGSLDLDLTVIHINHGLRGTESNRDEELVCDVSRTMGMDFVVGRMEPHKGKNLQDSARNVRYDFLKRVADERGAGSICLGHNRGDQAETILMHLLRGAGLSGIRGMKPVSLQDGFRIVRPLLFASRDDITLYAEKRGVAFREDSTNKKRAYRRNEIRHGLIPVLQKLNPRIEETLAATGERLAEDDDALEGIALACLEDLVLKTGPESIAIGRPGYIEMPAAIRKRILKFVYSELTGTSADLNSDQLKRMDQIATSDKRDGKYRLKAPWHFERKGERLTVVRRGGDTRK